MNAAAAVKNQHWSDDLRLPCFTDVTALQPLLAELETVRRFSIPFQSKHLPALKRDIWHVLQRPECRTRTGLLCLWPAGGCCVYVSGEPTSPRRPTPRVALLRLRVEPQFLAAGAGLTVFAATLSAVKRKLWIEDTLMWKGLPVAADETFRHRWERAAQWVEHFCILDPRLIGGLDVEMAAWMPLSRVRPDGVWEFQSEEPGRRRLLWIANVREPTPVLVAATAALEPEPLTLSAPCLEVGSLVAAATRESGPDQWQLVTADGVSLGRALIRTLRVSSELRSSAAGAVRLEVTWNPVFQKWEAVGISAESPSHSRFFADHK